MKGKLLGILIVIFGVVIIVSLLIIIFRGGFEETKEISMKEIKENESKYVNQTLTIRGEMDAMTTYSHYTTGFLRDNKELVAIMILVPNNILKSPLNVGVEYRATGVFRYRNLPSEITTLYDDYYIQVTKIERV